MELRQLEYFVAVAEEGTFTRAGRRVHVAQSAVSATIAKLERELGIALFTRDGPTTSLTDAGTALLPEARALLSGARRARETVDQVRGGLRGTIRLGILSAIGVRSESGVTLLIDLPTILGRFHVTHPLVQFRMRTAPRGTADHLAAVAADELDLALVGTDDRPPGVRLHRLGSVRFRFVCSRRHPLAAATSVTLEDLADETFIDFPPGWGNRTLVDRAFAGVGLVRDVPFEAADQDSALGLVRNDLGVSFLPRPEVGGDDVAVIEVSDAELDLPISLAVPDRPPSPATAALIAAVARSARRAGPAPS